MSTRPKCNAKSAMPVSSKSDGLPKQSVQRVRYRSNLVGSMIAKLRYQRGWRQDDLVARLQIVGCNMTRNILASIETRRSPVTDTQIDFFCRVFGVKVQDLFPPPCPRANRITRGLTSNPIPRPPCRLSRDQSDH
jgi:transcriptional regulator with XRE-family HTH domain